MFKNLLNKIKNFIKDEYKNIILCALLYIVFMWPLDYYIITGGGITKINDRIVVENQYDSKGSFNLAYVSEIKGTVATYLISYIMPNWERIEASEYTYDENETKDDVEFRGQIDLYTANDNAIKNAFLQANKTYTITDKNLYIYYVDPTTENEFKVGDEIVKVNRNEIKNVEDFKDELSKNSVDDIISITVIRNKKEKNIEAKLYKKDNDIILGIYLTEVNKYKTYPKVKFNYKNGESGPSGGLMSALDIYNKITKKDLTKGLTIAGTGEIDKNGNIGTIGGVKYKLLGAAKKKADIFLVPKGENYKECLKVAKENKLDIKIIGVSTLEEAIKKLEKI